MKLINTTYQAISLQPATVPAKAVSIEQIRPRTRLSIKLGPVAQQYVNAFRTLQLHDLFE